MKKIPLFLKVLVPIFIAVAAAGAFFAIKLADTAKKLDEKTAETEAAQAVPSDKYKSDFEETKDNYEFVEYDYVKQFYYYSETEIFHRYEYGNTEFVSFSEFWDEDMLKDLRDELFANEHGDEIYDLDSVVVYNSRYYDYPSVIEPDYERIDVAVSLYEIFPFDFKFPSYFKKNIISLDSGDFDTTIEDTAYELSHKYGLYYMNYYFDLYGDDIVEDDPYFKLRYDSDYDIFYKEDDYSDYDTYFENKESYLLEIAADDYVYLMGSPNTKKTCEFLDTYDELALDVKNKDDELREYFETTSGYHFNQTPISNVALPLPDRVDGLPELLYGAIGKKVPEYTDHSLAEEIEIKVKRRTKFGEPYYTVTWNKPWKDEGITYTLVGYDESNYMQGAIKTVDADEDARAIIGGAVYDTSATRYTFYENDFWKKQGFVRLRVIVTFGDGTAAISPALDWSFE